MGSGFGIGKQLMQGNFLETGDVQNLPDGVDTEFGVEPFPDDGHEYGDGDGDPDPGLHGIGRGAPERLDSQGRLAPLEEPFQRPPGTVEVRDRHGRQGEVVGPEDQGPVAFRVAGPDPPPPVRVVGRAVDAVGPHDLVADEARAAVHGPGGEAAEFRVRLRSQDAEAATEGAGMETLDVEVGSVHDIERPGLRHPVVKPVDVVSVARRTVTERWEVPAQVEPGVPLPRRLGAAERGPGEDREAAVDGWGVERVDRVVKIDAEAVIGIPAVRGPDQGLGEVGVEAPVPSLVGLGQRVARDRAPEAHGVGLAGLGAPAGLEVTPAFPGGQLGERHAAERVLTAEAPDAPMTVVAFDTAPKGGHRQGIHALREDPFASVHGGGSPNGGIGWRA